MNILKLGSKNVAVASVQKLLNAAGAKPALDPDGNFGELTEKAVRAYQKKVGLFVDGRVGEKTLSALNGANVSKLLRDTDIIRAATDLGVPQSSIRAIAQVESKGTGFLDIGKPKILFERHKMYYLLQSIKGKDFAAAQSIKTPNIVNIKRGGYFGGAAEHTRLSLAKNIDRDSAIESASWGQFQIMGFHWERLGYQSAVDFELQMSASESNHFDAFIRFIKTDAKLHKALKDEDWNTFAEIYNGSDYKLNSYDLKLLSAKRHFVQFDPVPKATA